MSISDKTVAEAGKVLYIRSLIEMPEDITRRIEVMRNAEDNELARFQLDKILENAAKARESGNVVCQDTGISSYKVRVGTKAQIAGDLAKALADGTAMATKDLPTIPHSVHPLTKVNSGTGTGNGTPLIHWDMIPGADYVEITAQPVGGGGDLCSTTRMFTGSAPVKDVKRFILETVANAGSKPCPPMIVGVGIGGMFETVNQLAKKAVMRPLDQPNSEPMIADMEKELFEMVNGFGIGPMGMGGKTTCLAVNIEYGNTGTYILPVAVKIGCWLIHRKTARIYNDDRIEYLD